MAVMARMHQGQKKGGAKRGWESFRGDQGAYTGSWPRGEFTWPGFMFEKRFPPPRDAVPKTGGYVFHVLNQAVS